jgi:hypothetical protein
MDTITRRLLSWASVLKKAGLPYTGFIYRAFKEYIIACNDHGFTMQQMEVIAQDFLEVSPTMGLLLIRLACKWCDVPNQKIFSDLLEELMPDYNGLGDDCSLGFNGPVLSLYDLSLQTVVNRCLDDFDVTGLLRTLSILPENKIQKVAYFAMINAFSKLEFTRPGAFVKSLHEVCTHDLEKVLERTCKSFPPENPMYQHFWFEFLRLHAPNTPDMQKR